MKDHIHMVVSIPPKISVSEFKGIIKGKTAIKVFKSFPGLRKNPIGETTFGLEDIVQVQ